MCAVCAAFKVGDICGDNELCMPIGMAACEKEQKHNATSIKRCVCDITWRTTNFSTCTLLDKSVIGELLLLLLVVVMVVLVVVVMMVVVVVVCARVRGRSTTPPPSSAASATSPGIPPTSVPVPCWTRASSVSWWWWWW